MGIKDRKWPVQRSTTDCSIGRGVVGGGRGGEVVCEKGAVQTRVSWKWCSLSYWGLRPEMKFCPNYVRFSSDVKRWCPPKVFVVTLMTIGPVKSVRHFSADVNLFMYCPCLLPVKGKSGVGRPHNTLLIIVGFVKNGAKKKKKRQWMT